MPYRRQCALAEKRYRHSGLAMLGGLVQPSFAGSPISSPMRRMPCDPSGRSCSGRFLLDEEILAEEGDGFSLYAVEPGRPLLPICFFE